MQALEMNHELHPFKIFHTAALQCASSLSFTATEETVSRDAAANMRVFIQSKPPPEPVTDDLLVTDFGGCPHKTTLFAQTPLYKCINQTANRGELLNTT